MCVLCVDTTFHNQADVMCVESEPFKLQHRGEGSLAGNNALVHYEYSHSYNQISHALSNIHGLYRCSCNLHDVKSVYSLNLSNLPGRFSYKQPGYVAEVDSEHLFPSLPLTIEHEFISSWATQINTTYVLHSIGNSPSDLKPVEWELDTRTLCSTYTHGHTYLKHEKINYEVDWSSHKCYILQPQTEASGVRAGHTYLSVVKPAL